MADWSDVDDSHGWEDIEQPSKLKQAGKNALGGIDAALTMAAGVIPYIGSGLAGLGTAALTGNMEAGEDVRRQLMESGLGLGEVKPVSKAGEEVTGMIEHGMDALKSKVGDLGGDSAAGRTALEAGTETVLNFLPIPGARGVRKLGNAIESKISRAEKEYKPGRAEEILSKEKASADGWTDVDAMPKETKRTPVQEDVARIHDQSILDRLREIDEGLETQRVDDYIRQKEAQQSIEARQAQMEMDVKRQATLERNAAERARQEAAPTGYEEHLQRRLDEKFERQFNKEIDEKINQALGDERGPIYVDPQGQAFRGDPREPNAMEALERQGAAMDTELTHLRGIGTPEGSPLRPLTDPTRPISSTGRIGRQRGAVDVAALRSAVQDGFKKIEEALAKIQIPNALARDAYPTMVELYTQSEDPRIISSTRSELRKLGYPRDVLDAFDTAIIAAHKYNLGKHQAEMDKKVVPFRPRGEKGSIDLKMLVPDFLLSMAERKNPSGTGTKAEVLPPEQRPPREDSMSHPTSPETIAAKQKQRRFTEHFPSKDKALDEFAEIKTKEEAIALAKDAKDISKDYGQKSLGSGINFHAAMSNNPVLKFARTVARDIRAYADGFSRKYITDNKTGLTPLWSHMSTNERIGVMDALFAGDKRQTKITDSVMDQLGFNDTQRQFVKTFYEADNRLFTDWNQALNKVGLSMVEERVGHFPGIFTGSYKTLVMDGKKVMGVIATDTVYQQKSAQKYVKEHYPNATFVEQKRQSLAGTTKRYYSDIFSGMNDVLEMLGKNDPRFKEVQDLVSGAIRASNNKLFNFNVHELNKKGVFGNEGNRPWKDAAENADDAFKALVRYFEEGAMHHAMQVPMKELREIATAPETAHLPNTKKFLDKYTKKMLGDDLSPLGAAINTIIDTPFKIAGIGPAVPLKLSGAIKNNMSQMFMGWGNYMFTAAQLVQPAQTGLPFMQLAATRLGVSPIEVGKSMGRGGAEFMRAFTEDVTGKDLGTPQHMRDAYHYARDRGLLTFSELEKAYQGTQTAAGRAKDQLAEFNMKIGEQATRTPMFMAFTDLLVNAGIEPKKAFPIAENLTQFSMIDYHLWERPMVYSNLGVLGGFMSGLTTFKHGLVSQQAYLAKQMTNPARKAEGGRFGRQGTPAALAIASMLALSGITGVPFYDEFDTVVKAITNKFGGKQKSIRELVLSDLPEWLNSGLISDATGLNIQGKFSSADMIPDSFARAASPHLEAAGKIIADAIDLAKSGADEQSVRNFLLSITPAGWKGAMENAVSKSPEGDLIGRDGLPVLHRTEDDWMKRGLTGLRPQQEAIERNELWNQRQTERADVERRQAIAKEYKRRIINNEMTPEAQEKLETEYMNRGGDPQDLYKLYQQAEVQKTQTEKERLQGNPNTLRGVNRFNYYNK